MVVGVQFGVPRSKLHRKESAVASDQPTTRQTPILHGNTTEYIELV